MSKEVGHDRATELLRETWREVVDSDDTEYADDYMLRQRIREVIRASDYGNRTFKYILVTNVLTKATNPDVHPLVLKEGASSAGHSTPADSLPRS